jgi:hypothetical protein
MTEPAPSRSESAADVVFYTARSRCGHIVRAPSPGGLVETGREWCPQCQRLVDVYAYGRLTPPASRQ